MQDDTLIQQPLFHVIRVQKSHYTRKQADSMLIQEHILRLSNLCEYTNVHSMLIRDIL